MKVSFLFLNYSIHVGFLRTKTWAVSVFGKNFSLHLYQLGCGSGGQPRTKIQILPTFWSSLTFLNNKEQPLSSGFIAVRSTHVGIQRCCIYFKAILFGFGINGPKDMSNMSILKMSSNYMLPYRLMFFCKCAQKHFLFC